MKKVIFMLAFMLVGGYAQAQDKAEESFLKSFPDLKVGKAVGEKECKTALKNQIKSETIGKIDYKNLLYDNVSDISAWIIMPIGKFKVAEGVYYLMYFSSVSGANHNDADVSYMLNLALLDFNQDKRIGENEGNDGEYIIMSKTRRNSLVETLGKDASFATKAGFVFTLNSANSGTLNSSWEYTKDKPKNTTFQIKWSSTNLEIK
jgi:hypothetical protein